MVRLPPPPLPLPPLSQPAGGKALVLYHYDRRTRLEVAVEGQKGKKNREAIFAPLKRGHEM